MTREATPVQSQDNHQQEQAAAAENQPAPETVPAAQVEQEQEVAQVDEQMTETHQQADANGEQENHADKQESKIEVENGEVQQEQAAGTEVAANEAEAEGDGEKTKTPAKNPLPKREASKRIKKAPKQLETTVEQKVQRKKPEKKMPFILYSYCKSSASWRVRLTLALKGFTIGKHVEYRAVNLVKDGGEHKKDEYFALNPAKLVPTLVVQDKAITGSKNPVVMNESMAICEWINEAYSGKGKRPLLNEKSPLLRQKCRQLCEIINSMTQPLVNLSTLQKVGELAGDDQKAPWARAYLERGLAAYEAAIAQIGGDYSMGRQLTLADVFLVPQLFAAKRFELDMTPYPKINRIAANLEKNPTFQACHPDKMPDAVL